MIEMTAHKKKSVKPVSAKPIPISVIGRAIMRRYKKAFRVLSHY